MHVFNQSDIESNELKTDGYTDLSFNMSYKLPIESKVSLYLKGTNLLDQEQRDHTSFLKDKTLMGERALTFGLSGHF
jgi:iron complex outermembrane receptor protein